MGGEADRARGAEAAAAVEGGERPALPVEGDGALRPAVGTGDEGAGDREDIDRTGRVGPGHGADRFVEDGEGHGMRGVVVQHPGGPGPIVGHADRGPVHLPARFNEDSVGGLRVGGRAVEGAGGTPADGVVRPPLAGVPVRIQRVGPGAPARGIGDDGARGDQQRRDFDDVGSWVHCNSSLLSNSDRRPLHGRSPGGAVPRAPVAGADMAAMGEGTWSDRLSPWPRPVVLGRPLRHSRR